MADDEQPVCRACGVRIDNQPFDVRDAYLDSHETFPYIECDACGTVQIVHVPNDLARYYPESYRPRFRVPGRLRRFLRRQRAAAVLGSRWNLVGRLVLWRYGKPDWASWLTDTGAHRDSRILDVGSGDGELLIALESAGFRHLTGVDPYIEQERIYAGGVRVHKQSLSAHEGEYDVIMLNHSLEHVSDPVDLLREVRRLLHPAGTALVQVPIAGNYGWRTYREHWSRLDPPRHLVVPTVEGMRRMTGAAGFRIDSMVMGGNGHSFALSEQARAGLSTASCYSMAKRAAAWHNERELAAFNAIAAERIAAGDGDAAAFYLKPA